MTKLIKRLMVVMITATLAGAAWASAPSTWPVSPSRLSLDTPYGNLHIATSEYVYESRLRIDGQDVKPTIRGILNITYAFSTPKAQVALVSVNNGNNGCPVTYRWIVLEKSGYKVSQEFGSCSEQIKVFATGRHFTMQTPSAKKPDKIDVYTYDGKTVKRRIAAHP